MDQVYLLVYNLTHILTCIFPYKIKKYLIEVKPERFTKPPNTNKRKTKRLLEEIAQYGVNEAKWKSAKDFCKAQGMEFRIVTEKELGI